MSDLMLHEEILLLTLDDEKGTVPFGSMYGYAMAGGVLTELVLRERVTLSKVKKSLMVEVTDGSGTGDPLLNETIAKVTEAKRRASVQSWVSRIAQTRKLAERVAERLRDRGILRYEEGRVLLFFPRQTWPANDPVPERDLVQRIRSAIEGDGPVAGRTATIIALANSVDLLKPHIGKGMVKERQERIKNIVSGNVMGDATREAIEAVTAAMIATTAAVTAVTAAASAS